MIDKVFHLSDGSTIETSIIGGSTITRQEGPGYYSYKELAPMGVEYYPRRNGIKIHYWIILIPAEKLTKTIEWFRKKENLLKLMKEPDRSNPFKPTEIPALFLFNIKGYLYNEKYIEWNAEYDEDVYIWVQARKNTPRSRLGWGYFEKDLESRL